MFVQQLFFSVEQEMNLVCMQTVSCVAGNFECVAKLTQMPTWSSFVQRMFSGVEHITDLFYIEFKCGAIHNRPSANIKYGRLGVYHI